VPKRKKHTDGDRIAIDSAVGVCGWLLIVETLVILERRGVLKSKDTKRIVMGALSALELLAAGTFPHPAFEVAREILMGQVEGWEGLRREAQ
jgi:hypothetical protein